MPFLKEDLTMRNNVVDQMSNPKPVAIIQARMASTRLPDKVMLDLLGKPILWHVVQRVKKSKLVENVVVAITVNTKDREIDRWCSQNNIPCFRGEENDVLRRYAKAARAFDADPIVWITADCPLIDYTIIDQVIELYKENGCDLAANGLPGKRTYPDGLDVCVVGLDALLLAELEAKSPYNREHGSTYITERPEKFALANLALEENLSEVRWTVDYPQDLENIQNLLMQMNLSYGFPNLAKFPTMNEFLVEIAKWSFEEDEVNYRGG